MIYPVDEKYQVSIPYNNPRHHRGKMIEAYALDYFKKNPVESEYTYLPIFWTGWHVSHGSRKTGCSHSFFLSGKCRYFSLLRHFSYSI